MNKRTVGSCYEQKAAAYLIEQGYEIITANYRCRQGEIDLIARHQGYLVFIEVKYRKDLKNGDPFEAVDQRKQQNIRRVARYYLYSHGLGEDQSCRFDVVAVLGEEIRLISNAF